MSTQLARVVYLDLLGFKDYCGRDVKAAVGMLEDFQAVLRERLLDVKLEAVTAESALLPLIQARDTTSFSELIPFSDSIVIISDIGSEGLLCKQLSTLLWDSFLIGGYAFPGAPDPSNPNLMEIKVPKVDADGKLMMASETCLWAPVLFRGSVVLGEIHRVELKGKSGGVLSKHRSVVGEAFIRAIGLERLGKGPRIFCESPSVLSSNYCVPYEKYYELLWPAERLAVVAADPQTLLSEFDDAYSPALCLWQANQGSSVEDHYYEFVRLLFRSSAAVLGQKFGSEGMEQLQLKAARAGLTLQLSSPIWDVKRI